MTRYPKSGRGRKWTVAELKAIGPAWKADTLADGEGLSGTVRSSDGGAVTVHWRYAFKRNGRVAWHYCGTWPIVSLEAIRLARDTARDSLRRGADPNEKRQADRIEEREKVRATIAADERRRTEDATVEELAREWLKNGVLRKDGNADLRRSFEKDLFPRLGSTSVRKVTEQDLRNVLVAIIGRGAPRVAVRLWRDLRQMFSWAEKRKPWRPLLIDGNPAVLIRIETIVPQDYDLTNTRSRTLKPAEIRELQTIFERMDAAYQAATDRRAAARPLQPETRIALWICLSTACRIGELLLAEWKHVDFDRAIWFIPVENVKGARGKKQEHRLHLSRFALKQFKALQVLTGKQRWCFPSRDGELHLDLKTISKQVGDRQQRFKERVKLKRRCHDDSLVLGGGANGEWTPHDLRRTAATMMQALGVSPDVIDRCQNHVLAGSKVRRHYLTHEYAAETREAWTKLGAEIETILRRAPTSSQRMRRRSARAASGHDAPRKAPRDAFPPEIIAGPALLRV